MSISVIAWLLSMVIGGCLCMTAPAGAMPAGRPDNDDDDDAPEPDAGKKGDESDDDADAGQAGDDLSADDVNSDDSQDGNQDSKTVPYDRFKEKNDEWKTATARAEAAESKLKQIEAQKQQQVAKPNASNQKVYSDPEQQKLHDTYIAPVEELKSEVEKLKNDKLASDYNKWIDQTLDGVAKSGFTEMNRKAVKNEFILNPKADLVKLAKASHNEYVGRDKSVITAYRQGKTKDATHKSGSPKGGGMPANKATPPKTFAEAKQAAISSLKSARKA